MTYSIGDQLTSSVINRISARGSSYLIASVTSHEKEYLNHLIQLNGERSGVDAFLRAKVTGKIPAKVDFDKDVLGS